jgi:hypothetical protein
MLVSGSFFLCHSRESGNPVGIVTPGGKEIPAFAGMTMVFGFRCVSRPE